MSVWIKTNLPWSSYVSLRTHFGCSQPDKLSTQLGETFRKTKSNILMSFSPAYLVPIRSPVSQQQPCDRSCQQAEDAHILLKQRCLPPPPPAPSLPPTWGQEDDYHQPAVLQCPDGHLPPAVHCRSVKFNVYSPTRLSLKFIPASLEEPSRLLPENIWTSSWV